MVRSKELTRPGGSIGLGAQAALGVNLHRECRYQQPFQILQRSRTTELKLLRPVARYPGIKRNDGRHGQ